MDNKVCYILNFYLGKRRKSCDNYKIDKLFYVKKQIEILQSTPHNLTRIIFNFNIELEHYHYMSEVYSIIPKSIQGAEVEINIRKNVGASYAAWSDLFDKYRSKYDYYIFSEDDYFFIEPNWDNYLVNKFKSYDDCGYLSLLVREPMGWNGYRKFAANSVGISSTEILTQIYSKYGGLAYTSDENYDEWEQIMIEFSNRFIKEGYNLYDIRDDYSMLSNDISPPGFEPKCNMWKHHFWNEKLLCVTSKHYVDGSRYFMCFDREYNKDYQPTSRKKAINCQNLKIDYQS